LTESDARLTVGEMGGIARRAHGRGGLRVTEVAYPSRVAISVLAFAAAMIRFSSVPAHAAHGAGGAVVAALAGWAGIVLAVAVMLRPRRAVLAAGAVTYAAFIVVWLASGPSWTFVELSQLGIQIALVVACAAALALPALGRRWNRSTFAVLSVLPVSVLALATAAVVNPPSVSTAAARPKVHKTTNAAQRAPVTFGSGLSATGNTDEQAELQPDVPLSPADQKLLAQQLVIARAAAMKYPTVADAKRAGMILAGKMAPGVGAHFLSIATTLQGVNADGSVNPASPGSYIYAGTSDDSPIVGLMYESIVSSDTPPSGFAGPNDHWHRHSNVCIQYQAGQIVVPFAPDSDVTQAQCQSVRGDFMPKTIWMVHAWVVPGYESPKGVFSHDNPDIHCGDGTNGVNAVGFCVHS
jgi:hypothetical protein